jgi:hypothetical protein
MLHSYQAQLNGSQLIWIDQPPPAHMHQRVVVVVQAQEKEQGTQAGSVPERVQRFRTARGCMGRAAREQVLAGLDSLREDWTRNPLGGAALH